MPGCPRDLISIQVSPERDPTGATLQAVLTAHHEAMRLGQLRAIFVHLIAVLSAVVWLLALWPGLDGGHFRFIVLYSWACLFLAALQLGVREWWWRRRRESCLRALPRPLPSQTGRHSATGD